MECIIIEFNIAATCDNEGLQRQSAVQPETSVNAFTILMSASKTKSSVPAKYDITQPSAKLKLKNDMIDWLSENKLGRENAYTETIGRTFVNTLVEVLWYVDGNFQTLHERSDVAQRGKHFIFIGSRTGRGIMALTGYRVRK